MANDSSNKDSLSSALPASSSSYSSSSAVDSYIGSFISLTSKYEIRYEGILYYLNPEDSTLGLKNVRSYGTEGRKIDGPQIPPSDKVYEYILFRGSDIKDLQVKSPLPAKREELIHNDPAIIQTHSSVGPSSLSKSGAVGDGFFTRSSSYHENHALGNTTYPGTLHSYQFNTPVGREHSQQATQDVNLASSSMPIYVPGYNGPLSNIPHAPQVPNPLLSMPATTSPPATVQNWLPPSVAPASTALGSTYSSNFAPVPSLSTSSSLHLNNLPTITPEQHLIPSSMPSASSLKASLPSHPVPFTANRGTKFPFATSGPDMNAAEAPVVGIAASDSLAALSVQSLTCSASLDSTVGPLLKQQPTLLTPDQFAQPRPPLLSSGQKAYPNPEGMLALNSAFSNLSFSATTAVQAPLLPLPLAAHRVGENSKNSMAQFTEEFDFEAMNEKFRKDEVWGYLGGAKQGDKTEWIEDNAVGQNTGHEGSYSSVPKHNPKAAYNKDDFFDTISCNSLARGPRGGVGVGGQNRFSQRMKQDTETFGGSNQGYHQGYGGYGSGHGEMHQGSYNWGTGYNYSGRGRGGHFRM